MTDDDEMNSVAAVHQNTAELLRCPICLDYFLNPYKSKCGHVFCHSCIDETIRNQKGRPSCPICKASSLSKRSLEPDAMMQKLTVGFKALVDAELADTDGQMDFMSMRLEKKSSRESNVISPGKVFKGQQSSSNSSNPVNPSSSKQNKAKPSKGKIRVEKEKEAGVLKTYRKPKVLSSLDDLDMDTAVPLPGEEIEGDDSFCARQRDRLNKQAKTETIKTSRKVEEWSTEPPSGLLRTHSTITGNFVDFLSQPPDDQQGESTPLQDPNNPQSALCEGTGSPDFTPVVHRRGKKKAISGLAVAGKRQSETKRSSDRVEVELPVSTVANTIDLEQTQVLPTLSQAVDVDDTFDKLVATAKTVQPTDTKKSPRQRSSTERGVKTATKNDLFSTKSTEWEDDSFPDYLSQDEKKSIMSAIESPVKKDEGNKSIAELILGDLKAQENKPKKKVSWGEDQTKIMTPVETSTDTSAEDITPPSGSSSSPGEDSQKSSGETPKKENESESLSATIDKEETKHAETKNNVSEKSNASKTSIVKQQNHDDNKNLQPTNEKTDSPVSGSKSANHRSDSGTSDRKGRRGGGYRSSSSNRAVKTASVKEAETPLQDDVRVIAETSSSEDITQKNQANDNSAKEKETKVTGQLGKAEAGQVREPRQRRSSVIQAEDAASSTPHEGKTPPTMEQEQKSSSTIPAETSQEETKRSSRQKAPKKSESGNKRDIRSRSGSKAASDRANSVDEKQMALVAASKLVVVNVENVLGEQSNSPCRIPRTPVKARGPDKTSEQEIQKENEAPTSYLPSPRRKMRSPFKSKVDLTSPRISEGGISPRPRASAMPRSPRACKAAESPRKGFSRGGVVRQVTLTGSPRKGKMAAGHAKPAKKSDGKIKFQLLGRIEKETRIKKREKVCQFLQLGLLSQASWLSALPSLKDLVEKRKRREMDAMNGSYCSRDLSHPNPTSSSCKSSTRPRVEQTPSSKIQSWLRSVEFEPQAGDDPQDDILESMEVLHSQEALDAQSMNSEILGNLIEVQLESKLKECKPQQADETNAVVRTTTSQKMAVEKIYSAVSPRKRVSLESAAQPDGHAGSERPTANKRRRHSETETEDGASQQGSPQKKAPPRSTKRMTSRAKRSDLRTSTEKTRGSRRLSNRGGNRPMAKETKSIEDDDDEEDGAGCQEPAAGPAETRQGEEGEQLDARTRTARRRSLRCKGGPAGQPNGGPDSQAASSYRSTPSQSSCKESQSGSLFGDSQSLVHAGEKASMQAEPVSEMEPEPSKILERVLEPEPSKFPERDLEPEPSKFPERDLEPEPSKFPERDLEPEPSKFPDRVLEPEPSKFPESDLEPEPSKFPDRELEPEPSKHPDNDWGSPGIAQGGETCTFTQDSTPSKYGFSPNTSQGGRSSGARSLRRSARQRETPRKNLSSIFSQSPEQKKDSREEKRDLSPEENETPTQRVLREAMEEFEDENAHVMNSGGKSARTGAAGRGGAKKMVTPVGRTSVRALAGEKGDVAKNSSDSWFQDSFKDLDESVHIDDVDSSQDGDDHKESQSSRAGKNPARKSTDSKARPKTTASLAAAMTTVNQPKSPSADRSLTPSGRKSVKRDLLSNMCSPAKRVASSSPSKSQVPDITAAKDSEDFNDISMIVSGVAPLPPSHPGQPDHHENSTIVPDSDDDMFSPTPDESRQPTLRRRVATKSNQLSTVDEAQVGNRSDDMREAETFIIPETEELSQVLSRPKTQLAYFQDTRQWKFVITGFTGENKIMFNRFLKLFPSCGTSSAVTEEVTHVVVKTEDDLLAPRTLKYLQGVAGGKMVVSHLWCEESLSNGKLVSSEPFQVKDMESGGSDGPRRARLARMDPKGFKGLLTGLVISALEPLQSVPKEAIGELVQMAGGRFVPDKNSFDFFKDCVRILITDSPDIPVTKVRHDLAKLKVVMVDKDWLFDSLGCWTVRPLGPHMVDGIGETELVAAGLPKHMVFSQMPSCR